MNEDGIGYYGENVKTVIDTGAFVWETQILSTASSVMDGAETTGGLASQR